MTPPLFGAKHSQCPLLIAMAVVIVLWGCGHPQPGVAEKLTIATFNIEWLGDGEGDSKPRTDSEYMRIADIIIKTGADVVGVQEIENQAALNKVLRFLKQEHEYEGMVLQGSGQQQTGVLWRKGIAVTLKGAYMPLVTAAGRSRPGFVVECKKGDFDWVMMVVHLKSTSRFDSTTALREQARTIRLQQVDAIVRWADSVMVHKDMDVAIVGDFNDFPDRKTNATLTAIVDHDDLHFATGELTSCKDSKWKGIDHVVVSSSMKSRMLKAGTRSENFYQYLERPDAEQVSDHCPVVVTFTLRQP
jgi:endonuclease/exonuclease/phosphatase family metal-dependent hydrolase